MIAYSVQDDMDRPLFGVSTRRFSDIIHHRHDAIFTKFRFGFLPQRSTATILLSCKERLLNLVVGLLTTVMVIFTFISAFVFPLCTKEIKPHNIAFSACIALVCASLLMLIYWYRQGDVDPKFRKMIYFNSFTIVLLCGCANWYFIVITADSDCTSKPDNNTSVL